MSYYTIRLNPDASKICTIIFPWGKYSYKQLPIEGIADLSDFFQGKMLEPTKSLKYAQDYLDDLLCISMNSLNNHLEKLNKVLRQLCNAGLKDDTEKSTFGALEMNPWGTYSQEMVSNLRVIGCRQYSQFNRPKK
jgi:hypothetical protein